MVGATESRFLPIRRRLASGITQKKIVLRVGDLGGRQLEHIHPNAVHRLLHILTDIAAHGKPAFRDGNHSRQSRMRRGPRVSNGPTQSHSTQANTTPAPFGLEQRTYCNSSDTRSPASDWVL